jgi:UDP-N-acetyl-D-galactosamine dehydrogenase
LSFTTDQNELKKTDILIVADPTPIHNAKQPDLSPLISASQTTGRNLKNGAIVIFESTVFPGATEDICIPELEKLQA